MEARKRKKKVWKWKEFLDTFGDTAQMLKEISAGMCEFQGKEKYHKERNKKLFDTMRNSWNKPDSLSSPYRYFHGAMKPIGLDEDDNVVYEVTFL